MADEIPETGAVFTFGRSRFADDEPSHFFIKNDPVVAISCGDEHSAVICQNGRVFVFGGNSWGQLGLGHKEEVTRPSCVKWLKPHRAMFVACGRAHTVFVTDTNSIYTVGCNDEGQLGTGDTEHHSVPQYVELGSDDVIRQVSAGSNHTAVLTDEGRVFVCGSNTEGQLGLGEDTKSAVTFQELKFMEKIAFVECGYYHTVFITVKGAVFVTGDNENNKLGIRNPAPMVYVPEVLPIDTPIKSACCGASHTFLLSMDEANVFGFGSNEKGQLGLPEDVQVVTEPTEIDIEKMFDGFQLKLVACGATHTAFVTDNGLLYTCGESQHNKLCLDSLDGYEDTNANGANQYSPKRVTAMNGYIVDNVACGGYHTLLTATKETNHEPTNDIDMKRQDSTSRLPMELPPLKIHANMKDPENNDMKPTDEQQVNGKSESGSIDSLEANVSGSHIVNINDLDDNGSIHDAPDLNTETDINDFTPSAPIMSVMNSVENMIDKAQDKIEDVVKDVKDTASDLKDKVEDTASDFKDKLNEKVEVVEEMLEKTVAKIKPGLHCGDDKRVLGVPDITAEVQNSPPPKTPILPELLQLPDMTELSPNLSRSDDGQKSENGQSENETIPCDSDKSSPQAKTKTQAVMPIKRSDDIIDLQSPPEHNQDVVVNKMEEKGRFSRIFQSIKDKENSCMSKGKVIEDQVTEQVHKTIEGAEETVHRVEETVESEIRNQTNSRACTIL